MKEPQICFLRSYRTSRHQYHKSSRGCLRLDVFVTFFKAGGSVASFEREPGLINAGGGAAHDGPSQPSSPGADTSGLPPPQVWMWMFEQGWCIGF